MIRLFLLLTMLFTLQGAPAALSERASKDSDIPRLPPGPHMGLIVGFDPLDPARQAWANELMTQAEQAGATLARLQIDWTELEPRPGVYDLAALEDAFDTLHSSSQHVFLTFSTLDTDGLTLPYHIMDEDRQFREGLTLNSPEVLASFRNFLTWLTPYLRERGVWGIALGNEIGGPIDDLRIDHDAVYDFYKAGRDAIKGIDPNMAVTVTFTMGLFERMPELGNRLMGEFDIACFNYYCINKDFEVSSQPRWKADIEIIKANAQGKEIFLQELGCPTGYADGHKASYLHGSLERQAEFFEFFAAQFASDPQLRGATVFQLFDWQLQTIQMISDYLREEGFADMADMVDEWHVTLGLCRWEEMTCRPAWQAWLNGLGLLEQTRQGLSVNRSP